MPEMTYEDMEELPMQPGETNSLPLWQRANIAPRELLELRRKAEALEAANLQHAEDAAHWKEEYERACKLVADMHAAAVGEVTGPFMGVVEDVAELRKALLGIHEMALEDLRQENINPQTSIWQIEADARAALHMPREK